MSNIDEEIRRAEEMALAVASTPNLRASEAKKMVSNVNSQGQNSTNSVSANTTSNTNTNINIMGTSRHTKPQKRASRRRRGNDASAPILSPFQSQSQSQSQSQPNRTRLDSSDEEVRRAREMALAVAALGTEKGVMKAEEIRMAVADVIIDPNELHVSSNTITRKDKRQQLSPKGKKLSPHTQQQGNGVAFSDGNEDQSDSRMHTIIEEILRPPWILRNQSLFATVSLANILILYVALSSAPCYTKLSNAVFIFNATVSFFCVVEKRDPQNMTAFESAIDTELVDDEENKKKQEALVDEMEKRIRPEKSVTLEWLPDVQYNEVDLQNLLDLQPESTLAERRRFLKARKGVIKAASAQLGTYFQWRSRNKIDEFFPSTFTTDEEDWVLAARGAMEIANTNRKSPASDKILPRIVSVYGGNDGLVFCRNGARIVHVLPSQLDTTIAPGTTYALALAMYLDRKLDRNHTEKVTVVIDIRSGKGWPNPSSVSLVPFIKLVVGSLNSYFPERLSRCILFPLPLTATVIFNKAKGKKEIMLFWLWLWCCCVVVLLCCVVQLHCIVLYCSKHQDRCTHLNFSNFRWFSPPN